MKKIAFLLSLSLLLISISGCVKSTSPATTEFPPDNSNTIEEPTSNMVKIKDFSFMPAEITIQKGDTITWVNQDTVQHTITSDQDNELDSELLSNEQVYSHTFNQTGTFPYHCTPHPYMKAQVIVQ